MSSPPRGISRFFKEPFVYSPTHHTYVANTAEHGCITALQVPARMGELEFPRFFIGPTGNSYRKVNELLQREEFPAISEENFARLFDCITFAGKHYEDRRHDLVTELSRDIYQEHNPVGEHDPVVLYRLNSGLIEVTAELRAYLQHLRAYLNNTLLYDYVRRTDSRNALFKRKDHAVFL